jgi:anti-sigma regulatory factor (Ser/Thr protein kinase)
VAGIESQRGGLSGESALGFAAEASFRHSAVFCDGDAEFVQQCGDFLDEAVEADLPVLVMLRPDRSELLKSAMSSKAAAGSIEFADMSVIGKNPARIIPAWQDFVSAHSPAPAGSAGIGEPIWAERDAEELIECERHEALLNRAFSGADFDLICPYDEQTLSAEVLETARRNHPYVWRSGEMLSTGHDGLALATDRFDVPLAPPPADAAFFHVTLESLTTAREFVANQAARAGLDRRAASEVVLSAHELATNSIRHANGSGVIRSWTDNQTLIVEVSDQGAIDDAMIGRRRPTGLQVGSYGHWIANQMCDLVQVRTFDTGSAVRIHMRLTEERLAKHAL